MRYYDKTLDQLSKEQLIYLIDQLDYSLALIGEVCVDESKMHISSERAVEKIRGYIYHMPSTYNVDNLKAYIDMKMGKISVPEYRKIIGLED
jgi:hypothetical protein